RPCFRLISAITYTLKYSPAFTALATKMRRISTHIIEALVTGECSCLGGYNPSNTLVVLDNISYIYIYILSLYFRLPIVYKDARGGVLILRIYRNISTRI